MFSKVVCYSSVFFQVLLHLLSMGHPIYYLHHIAERIYDPHVQNHFYLHRESWIVHGHVLGALSTSPSGAVPCNIEKGSWTGLLSKCDGLRHCNYVPVYLKYLLGVILMAVHMLICIHDAVGSEELLFKFSCPEFQVIIVRQMFERSISISWAGVILYCCCVVNQYQDMSFL